MGRDLISMFSGGQPTLQLQGADQPVKNAFWLRKIAANGRPVEHQHPTLIDRARGLRYCSDIEAFWNGLSSGGNLI
ncbi:hypothetical protein EYZ11_010062 [Aspergillus tanneri]|uniref:Uncharacterized protein n=1 Tax=Aspergillus tanneri TaxID=1220188 RepID=A0A4S3J6B7_9EURO|nr:hypothetical protein EYZ11_010062 [Aspergillus tanneri]